MACKCLLHGFFTFPKDLAAKDIQRVCTVQSRKILSDRPALQTILGPMLFNERHVARGVIIDIVLGTEIFRKNNSDCVTHDKPCDLHEKDIWNGQETKKIKRENILVF